MIRILRRCLITAAATTLLVVGSASAADASQGSVGVLSDQDRAFLVGAHQSNLAEIASGKLAQTKGNSDQVKTLGALFVAGQIEGHAKAMALGEKELAAGSDAAVLKAASRRAFPN